MGKTDEELPFEQERNKDYIVTLGRQKVYPIHGVDLRKLSQDWGPLLGRVSLSASVHDDGEFYVGPRAAILSENVRVVSWAAPAAEVLFNNTIALHGQDVRVKRRFHIRGHHVTGFSDTWVSRDSKEAFPSPQVERSRPRPRPGTTSAGSAAWKGPEAPNQLDEIERRRQIREGMRAGRHAAVVADQARRREQAAEPEVKQFLRQHPDLASALDQAPEERSILGATQEDELISVLRAPRGDALKSILPTLQPSQYRAVTSDPQVTHVFAGHPGTGKTVIATHRAAWLTNQDRQGALDYVLAVGPTDGWSTHVEHVISDLGERERVEVRSLPGLFNWFLESKWVPPVERDRYLDTDKSVGEAILALTSSTKRPSFEHGYAALRAYRSPGGASYELQAWCRALPESPKDALMKTELWPALALLRIRCEKFTKFQHVIVDEAQDLRPLEWMVLRELNGGQWTIVGDLNQRRTAFTPTTWEEILGYLGVQDVRPIDLEQGFRTTQQITDFASRLLGKKARRRASAALGDGEAPRVVDARAAGRTVESVGLTEVKRLAKKHPQGRLAVITPKVQEVAEAALRAGWTRAGATNRVGRYRLIVSQGEPVMFHLLSPHQARGLEFDAVVVVEPADFPTLLGRFGQGAGNHGPLYTSLTRANLSLSVVHWKPLPSALVDPR